MNWLALAIIPGFDQRLELEFILDRLLPITTPCW